MKALTLHILVALVMTLGVGLLFSAAYAQDPGPPAVTVDPTQDFRYRLRGGEWQSLALTDVADDTSAITERHHWVCVLRQATPNMTWKAPFPDSLPEAPHTVTFTFDAWQLIIVPFFLGKLEVQWRARVYEGTAEEGVYDWSETGNHVWVVRLGRVAAAIRTQ